MKITKVQSVNFRNLAAQTVELKERINFFVGQNGHGKTNFLEKIYLLARGTTFRSIDKNSLIKSGMEASRIRAQVLKNDLSYDLKIELSDQKKKFFINNKAVSKSSLLKNFSVILFSPESLSAIKGGPEQRRLILNEMILTSDAKNGALINRYIKILRARNRVLTDIKEKGFTSQQRDLLQTLTDLFLPIATAFTQQRLNALHNLIPETQTTLKFVMSEGIGDISGEYLISDQNALNWTEHEIYNALHKRSVALQSAEIASGRTLVGPHKHDLRILVNGKDSRFYCSQGQQRALILSLKIAQIVYHQRVHQTYPVLLLDDVMSELDAEKRINLMNFLNRISAQVLITSTDLTWSSDFASNRNLVFSVQSGRIEPQDLGSH